jgi:CheY-like chemotaxis protein
MFKELGDLFEPRAQKHGVIVSILVEDDVPRELLGDAIRIRQILSNLAGNAIKFTEHGEVDIIARLIEASAADVKIRIEVKDSGIGIPSSMNQSIFESFTQGESGNIRASSGTGLGLTICRKLADLMGGKVDYTSEEGKGSTFWLELTLQRPDEPVVKPSETSRSNEKPIVASGQKLRILVAEDNAVNQMVARGLIAKIGHDVTIVENGAEALEILSRESFDLILMDIQMPIMDGYTATAEIRIREAALGRRTPIVALTAYAMKDERQNCLNADMDDYLSKPISIVKLRELLERFNLETPKA